MSPNTLSTFQRRKWLDLLACCMLGCISVILWIPNTKRDPEYFFGEKPPRIPTPDTVACQIQCQQVQQHQKKNLYQTKKQRKKEANGISEIALPQLSTPPLLPLPPPPADPPVACFRRFPWIEPALDRFFERARASAALSLQTTEESIEALAGHEWPNKYHPGVDACAL
jgi:hypothetical protein